MNHAQKGFTLVELAIAIAIIAISFYALINVFALVAPQDVNARSLAIGTHLLNEKIEETTVKGFSGVSPVGLTYFPPPFSTYRYQVTVNYVTTAEPDAISAVPTPYKKIRVNVLGPDIRTLEATTLLVTYEVKMY